MIHHDKYTSTTINDEITPVSFTFLDFLLGLEGLGGVEVLQGVLSNILPLPVVNISKIKLPKMHHHNSSLQQTKN
jgi:hypothetical protein